MNPVIEHFVKVYKGMPLSRRILSGSLILLVIAGFAAMFIWANKVEYQAAYTHLAPEDAAAITGKLKEKRIPYRLEGGGSAIMVPAENVYDVRLSLAAAGLPRGGGVGYEIFDKNDFGTTDFVQKLNYQRALQGELARTIKEFDEVSDAKVMIVLPKDSVFIEETKPPSASILLKLKSDLNREKVDAVVHLVSSAIEGLTPGMVTVVDTTGRVLFKGTSEEEKVDMLANAQLNYKNTVEKDLTERIQTMLERIVGKDKAIVRVTSEIDFDRVDVNEEVYDPDVQVIRSRKTSAEDIQKQHAATGKISSVNPVPADGSDGKSGDILENTKKQDETVNYEISRTVRRTTKPVAVLTRLSVAAVIDGKYVFETGETGESKRKHIPRSEAEMDQFRKIVEKAMGYNEDRDDQVSVECFPFSTVDDFSTPGDTQSGWEAFKKEYGRSMANGLLIILLFLLIIRPIMKTVKEIQAAAKEPALPAPEESGEENLLEAVEEEVKIALPKPPKNSQAEKAAHYARHDLKKTVNILKGWLNEDL